MAKSNDSRKTYRELKADPVIKTPALAWLLERKSLYISFGAVTSLLVGGFLYQGWQSYEAILAPVEVESPYRDINPTQSHGAKWASEIIKTNGGVADWSVRDSIQPSHGFLREATGNSVGEVPLTLLATKLGSGGSTKTIVQVYGAGQARAQYDIYAEKLAEKGPISNGTVDSSGIVGAKFEQGFLLVAGDAIVGAQTGNNEERDRLFDAYLAEIKVSLPASECVDITGSNAASRSIYYDADSFEGLRETTSIDPEVKTDNLPTLKALESYEVANPYAEQPEGPLPASMKTIPAEVPKPTIADAPGTIESFTKNASYKIQDPVGPGCGWDWSAQQPPVYDDADLENTKKDTIVRVQNEVNADAQKYVDSKISWARITALLAPKLDSWNNYVKSVNNVHNSWDKLVADRNAIRPQWDTYIADYSYWSTFDQRKADAQREYNEAVKKCEADRDALEEWEKEWGEEAMEKKQEEWDKKNEELNGKDSKNSPTSPSQKPSPTPSPSPTETLEPLPEPPAKPAGCDFDPVKPSILSESKPPQPTAPELPADVTIPNSWPKPQ